jgi:glutamine amidotransferase
MIGIIDYGVGNVSAFLNVFQEIGVPVAIVTEPTAIKSVDKLILPGVGSFDYAMQAFNDAGFREYTEEAVLARDVPILGICVGMQMLANSSDEGMLPGFGWLDASVKRLSRAKISNGGLLPLPHMGWNDVVPTNAGVESLFEGISITESKFYFLHSYFFSPNDKLIALAEVEYGIKFCCAASKKNIYGVQFHPEKSHGAGAKLLKNFSKL